VNPTDVRVEEAMVQNVFTVEPDAPVAEVVETMIERKLGSAVSASATCDRRVHEHRRASRVARAARATVRRSH
jgi:CBS domain-containing protein